MPYNDFVRNVLRGSVPTTIPISSGPGVPGVTAPVTFTPMPGTNVSPAMYGANQAVQQNDQAVAAQQQLDQQRSAAAEQAQKKAQNEWEKKHRGGGFFGPLRRAGQAISDYPETLSALYQNVKDHPLSISSWGTGALGVGAPLAAAFGIPLDYMKMYAGEGLYRAAKGDYAALMAMGGPVAVAAGKIFHDVSYSNYGNSSIADAIIWAHDQGYNNWTGGNAVWEIMTYFETEHLPDPLKYSIRALNDMAFDPFTWVGAGGAAVKGTGMLANVERGSELAGMNPARRLLSSQSTTTSGVLRDVLFPEGIRPIKDLDRLARAANAPYDFAIAAPFRAAKAIGMKTVPGAFEPSPFALAKKQAREVQQPVLGMERDLAKTTTDGVIDITNTANLPAGFTGTMKVETNGDRVITLTDTNVKQDYTITVTNEKRRRGTITRESQTTTAPDGTKTIVTTASTPDGDSEITRTTVTKDGKRTTVKEKEFAPAPTGTEDVIRVTTPLDKEGTVVPTIEDAFTAIMQAERNIDLSVPGREMTSRRDIRDIAGGGVEISAPGRGSVYTQTDEFGNWFVTDEQGTMLALAKNANEAKQKAHQVLDKRPFKAQSLGATPQPNVPPPSVNMSYPNLATTENLGDVHVGPAFGADVTKSRPMDVVAREHAGTAKGTFFNKTVGNLLQGPKKTIENEEDWINRMKPVTRADMSPTEAAQRNRPGRVIDTPAKVMAQLKGTIIGQRHFKDIFGDRETPWPRLWSEDQASIIKTPGTDVELKYQINHRDAAYQAVMDPSDENAKLIIDYFKKRAKLAIPKERLEEVLIEPGMANRFAKSKKNVNYGRILEANREAFITGRGHTRVELPPYVLEEQAAAGALPASTGPLPNAQFVSSGGETNTTQVYPGQRFLKNPEDAARLGEDTGKRYAGPIEATPEGVQATYQTGANKGKPVKGSILESVDQPSIGDVAINGQEAAGAPITHMTAEPTTPLAQPRPKAGPTLQQQLEAAYDDPVEHRKAADNFVNEVVTGTAVRTDPGKSGYRSYVLKNTEGNEPNTSIHIGDNNTIVVTTTLPSDDPVIRNIVARAGDDAKITVRQGLPDLVGEPFGLKTARVATTNDHFGDLVYRGWMLNKWTDEERAALEKIISLPNEKGSGTRQMRVADAYLVLRSRHNGDSRAAFTELGEILRKEFMPAVEEGAKKKPPTIIGKVVREAISKWDSFINHQRDVLMFNWATGPVSALLDHMGDTARAASEGHIRAAIEMQNPRIWAAGMREARGDIDALLNASEDGRWYLSIFPEPKSSKYLKQIGRTEPLGVGLGTGREETHREGVTTIEKWLRSLNRIDDNTAKNIRRAASLVLLDGSGFVMHLRSAGDASRRFVLAVDAMRRATPDAKGELVAKAAALGKRYKQFDAERFARELGDAFNPEDVKIAAMHYGLPEGQAETLMRSWTNQTGALEKVGRKRLDEVFFSYEATQADEVLKRVFLFHYWYTRASVAYTRTIIRNPYLYVNYMRAMTALEKDSENQPSALKGMIHALAAPGGFSIFMDPFKFLSTAVSFRNQAYNDGEGGIFDAYLSQAGLFLNPALQAAASMAGWSANNNPDPFTTFQMRRIFGGAINLANAQMGGGVLGAPYQEAMNNWVEGVSKVASHWTGGSPRYAKDPKATDKILIRTRAIDLIEKDLGITPGTDFGEWTPEQLQVLNTAMDALDSGDDNPYVDTAYKEWAQANFTRNTLGMVLPFGFSVRSDARDTQLMETQRIPDPNDPTNTFAPVGSEGYKNELDVASAASGEPTNLAISDAQFDALFPANSAGRMVMGPEGQTQQSVLDQPQNAIYAQYREWKKTVGDYRQFRTRMERVSPAYRNYMNDLRGSEPYKSDETALDNAGVSYGAYVVLNGGKTKQFSRNPAPTLDMSAMNPSELGGSQQTPSYTGPTSYEDLGNQIQSQLMGYYQDQVAFDRIATQMFGHPVQMDLLSPIGQRMIRSRLTQMGVHVPELGGAAAQYQAWARSQPQGTPTNIADYLDYLRMRNGQVFPGTMDPNSMQAYLAAS